MSCLRAPLRCIAVSVLISAGFFPTASPGQTWPQKPIRIILPIIQGGSSELMLRVAAPTMIEALGQQIVIENRPGGSGIGSTFHLRGESMKIAAGIDMLHVPYKGTTQAMQDAVGGRLDLTFGTPASSRPLREAGKLVAIGVSNAERFPGLPDVPSFREVLPAYENPASLFALWGPAGLPQTVVLRMNSELLKAMEAPKLRAWLADNGLVIEGRTPRDLVNLHKATFETYRKIIATIGLKPE